MSTSYRPKFDTLDKILVVILVLYVGTGALGLDRAQTWVIHAGFVASLALIARASYHLYCIIKAVR